jgi:hypothetical protein
LPCALVVGNEQNLSVSIVVLLERRAKLLWLLFTEFLKARIVPERLEHRIEPEQSRSVRRKLSEKFSLRFRRERGDDFFEARIAAERVPDREQF